MINALVVSFWVRAGDLLSLQSDEIESLLELLESEFPSWIELECQEEACKGDTTCWEVDV